MRSPKSLRLHIGLFGRRNVGKSSLLNALTGQQVSVVADIAGTTTDPVEKAVELLPLGPVLFIDTAGIDDEGPLGGKRREKTLSVIDRTDLGIIITDNKGWGGFEENLFLQLQDREIPVIVVMNKADLPVDGGLPSYDGLAIVRTSVSLMTGFDELRQAILQSAPDDFVNSRPLIADLIHSGDMTVLVVPVDSQAPKGRLILPQVQCIRELLDNGLYCVVVRDMELKEALARLNSPPALVVTDSQMFAQVAGIVPQEIPLTGFSILFARNKGDLNELAAGAAAINGLQRGDRILVAEACSHHPGEEDIARVKIPRLLDKYTGGGLCFEYARGHDMPGNIEDYSLIIHCGACMWNRREMLSRIMRAQQAGVPITNYGLTIALATGILDRALQPFPDALQHFQNNSV